jgi:hypothetical protein
MKTLTLPLAIFRDPVFAHASTHAQAVWLMLLAYCCERENWGAIEGAASWGNAEWLKQCGLRKRDIEKALPLIRTQDESITVWMYPIHKQREIERKREGGKKGGSRKQKPPVQGELMKTEASEKPKEEPKKDNRPTTDTAKRIADIYKRPHDKAWKDKEIAAFRKALPITEDELRLVEKLYASDYKFKRRNLITFLNQFHGEVDIARGKFPQQKPQQKAGDPEGWREWLESKNYQYVEYSARGYLREEFHREKK